MTYLSVPSIRGFKVWSGTGLGLSIVRAVVAAHGGQVYAEAVPDGGLTVTVRLPATP